MSKTAEIDLITQFRALMYEYFPYIGHYMYSLNPVPRPGLGTMAVDRQGHMYYDPDWSETLTLEQGGYVCCHESWHLILRHCHRARQIIGDNPTPQQRMDLNIAADIIVWLMMEEVAHMAPEGGVTYPNAKERWPEIERDMTLQQLYSIIHRQEEEDGIYGEEKPGEENSEKGTEQDPAQKESGDSQGREKGKGKGEPTKDDCSGESSDDGGSGEDQAEDGEGSSGEEVDDHGYQDIERGSAADGQPRDYETEENDAWDAYIEDSLLEKVEEKIEELEATSEQWNPSRGRIPGRLKRVIKQKLRPTVNPWDRLKDSIARAISQNSGTPERTFQRRNRRQSCMQHGVLLAGERKYKPTVAVIMDTSGSMTRMCLAKAAAICDQGTRAVGGYRLVCWDYNLQLDEEVKGGKIDWPCPGGGGTCMTSAIQYVMDNPKHYGKPDVIICVTDGGTGWPNEMTKGTKLVIALTQDSCTPDYAITVRIPDPGKTKEEVIE